MSDFAAFLSDLDLDVPSNTPPIGINPGSSTGGSSAGDAGTLPYHNFITFGERSLGSQEAITAVYSVYIFNQILLRDNVPTNIFYRRVEIDTAASIYYNWSFWDHRSGSFDRWADVFWKIRGRVGKRFADSLMAYTIKAMLDDRVPNKDAGGKETDKVIDNYIYQMLFTADLIVDNLNSKMPVIIDIIKSSPLQVDLPETN